MKKTLLTIIFCLGCFGFLEAQNIWKPIPLVGGTFGSLDGVALNGDLFRIDIAVPRVLFRSRDDGHTWATNFASQNPIGNFTIGNKGRLFAISDRIVYYSDDNGDNWFQTSPINDGTGCNYFSSMKMYSPSNDTLVGWESPYLIWTLDGGATWDSTHIAFMEDHQVISDLIVNEEGDVYASIWYYIGPNIGVYHTTLSDMHNWELVAFEDIGIKDLEFDPEGNVVCGVCYGGMFSGFEHEPGFYAISGNSIGVAENGIVYKWNSAESNTAVLAYSLDHGEHFTEIGEGLPLAEPLPGSEDGFLFMGHDNHLYFYGNEQYYKCIRNANDIQKSGILTRVAAPFFEQNASDNRLAIVAGDETYYTMVHGFWPDPDADALIIDFDTIPIGAEIEVVGAYSLMEDENGNNFKVIDIEELVNPTYHSSLGYLTQQPLYYPEYEYTWTWSIIDQKTNDVWFITINGELQTEFPMVVNGMTLTDSIRYSFVGIPGSLIDTHGRTVNVLELTDALPYEPSFITDGFLTLENNLCLGLPCGETMYLTLDSETEQHYLTLVGKVQHDFINEKLFSEGVQAQIGGLEATHYDLFGNPFQTLEILEMECAAENTLVGPMISMPSPNIGPFPTLGVELALYQDDIRYYTYDLIEWAYPLNGSNTNYVNCYIVDNDTLIVGKEVTAQFTTFTMRIDNNLKPCYRVTLDHADYYDHLETLHGRLRKLELIDWYMLNYVFVTDDNESYLIEPYFLMAAENDQLVLGQDTLTVGTSFTATGEVFKWYDEDHYHYYYNGIHIQEVSDIEAPSFNGSEWYYEIFNDDGSITYQYMYQAGDSIINNDTAHILVKINTLYDKGLRDEVTHEYVYERDGKLYWWNKTLGVFTVLYDFSATVGDEWEIKIGTESLIMHVDAVENIEYEGRTYRMLRVSDAGGLFSGDIVCGIGHLTSFFPERLMNNGDCMRVEGLRCYWIEDELAFKYGDEDCDAIYNELHGIEEDGPSTGSGTMTVYPNPTDGVLFVQTLRATSLHTPTYRITNLMGQTLLTGQITSERQQIDVSTLPQGMYFITFAGETRKFVVR